MKNAHKTSVVLSLFLLVLALCLFPAKAHAAEIVSSGTCGENVTWILDSDGVLTVSGTGPMQDYSSSTSSPFYACYYTYSYKIDKVIVEEGVTSIGANAFHSIWMRSVTLPNSLVRIGKDGFSNCHELKDIKLPDQLTYIGENAFYHVPATITVPKSVEYIGLAQFSNIYRNLVIEEGNSVYYQDEYGVIYNTRDGILMSCPVNIQGEYVIADGTQTVLNYAFGDCTGLTEIIITDSVKSIAVTAFDGCTNLKKITVGTGLEEPFPLFADCSKIESFIVAPDNSNFMVGENGILFTKDKSKLVMCPRNFTGSYTVPESVTILSGSAFADCTALTEIMIHKDVIGIDDYAFLNCSSLRTVRFGGHMPFFGYGEVFEGVPTVSIYYPDNDPTWDIDILDPEGCFGYDCTITWVPYETALETDILDGGTCVDPRNAPYTVFQPIWRLYKDGTLVIIQPCSSELPIDSGWFGDYDTLAAIKKVELDLCVSSHYLGEDMFKDCVNLKEVTFPEGQRSIDNGCFQGCTSLEEILIPDTVSWIGSYAFEDCESLKNIVIPDAVSWIGSYAFEDCESLKNIVIPQNVQYIWNEAFYSCDSLEKVTISGNLKYLESRAFGKSGWEEKNSILVVEFLGDAPSNIYSDAFENNVAIAYYPADNATWTADIMQDYGGDVTWIPLGGDAPELNILYSPLSIYDMDCLKAEVNDAAVGELMAVAIDGWELDADSYTVEENGLKITVNPELIANLSEGMHILKAEYTDRAVGATFEVQYNSLRFELAGTNMELGSDLTMYFYLNASDIPGTEYSIEVKKSYHDGRADAVATYSFADLEKYSDTLYRVGFSGIAAKKLCDEIRVTVYSDEGRQMSNTWTDSIRDYAIRMLDQNSDAKTSTLMADLLNYGAAAQQFFGYNTGDLANSTMTSIHQSYATQNFSMDSFSNEAVAGTGYIGSTLSLNTNICLTIYFNGSIVDNSMKAVVSYTDHYGTAHSFEVSGSEFVANGSYKGVKINSLAAADAESLVTVEIYNGSTVVASASDSVEGYAVRNYAGNSLFVELMKFSASAYAYFHS